MVIYYKIIIFFVELQHLKMLIVPLCLDVVLCVSCHPRYGIIASGAIGNDRSVKICKMNGYIVFLNDNYHYFDGNLLHMCIIDLVIL